MSGLPQQGKVVEHAMAADRAVATAIRHAYPPAPSSIVLYYITEIAHRGLVCNQEKVW